MRHQGRTPLRMRVTWLHVSGGFSPPSNPLLHQFTVSGGQSFAIYLITSDSCTEERCSRPSNNGDDDEQEVAQRRTCVRVWRPGYNNVWPGAIVSCFRRSFGSVRALGIHTTVDAKESSVGWIPLPTCIEVRSDLGPGCLCVWISFRVLYCPCLSKTLVLLFLYANGKWISLPYAHRQWFWLSYRRKNEIDREPFDSTKQHKPNHGSVFFPGWIKWKWLLSQTGNAHP